MTVTVGAPNRTAKPSGFTPNKNSLKGNTASKGSRSDTSSRLPDRVTTPPKAAEQVRSHRSALTYVGYDATRSDRARSNRSPEIKAREDLKKCKERPTDNKPRGGGGGGRKRFVPWC